MPYVEPGKRDTPARTAGELNYKFAVAIVDYLRIKGKSYQTFNDIIGALECQKQELYRRKIAPYEDRACEKNGDVYDP